MSCVLLLSFSWLRRPSDLKYVKYNNISLTPRRTETPRGSTCRPLPYTWHRFGGRSWDDSTRTLTRGMDLAGGRRLDITINYMWHYFLAGGMIQSSTRISDVSNTNTNTQPANSVDATTMAGGGVSDSAVAIGVTIISVSISILFVR